MADTKQDVLDMLRDLAELTMLDEGDPQSFRVRAYESAAQAVAAQANDLGTLTAKDLVKIEGIGKSTAEKIRELLETGKVEKLEALRAKHPSTVVALLRIPGLGPKAVKKLRAELRIESVDDLRHALAGHKLRELPGFGAKSEEKLAQALARLDEQGDVGRTPISVALPLANRIVAHLREVKGVRHAEFCGSLRRFSETRRRHPFSSDERTLLEAIDHERALLEDARELGFVFDTSDLSAAALRGWIKDFIAVDPTRITLLFESFGFKHGVPLDADLVFDVRCLPNPYYEPELAPLCGSDAPVIAYLEAAPEVERMYTDIYHFVASWLPDYARDNRNYLTVAIGCTGGRHRSVYLVERLAKAFSPRYQVLVRHRELE